MAQQSKQASNSYKTPSVFEPPAKQLKSRLHECSISFWPHGVVAAHGDTEALVQNWTDEYACLGYGADSIPRFLAFVN